MKIIDAICAADRFMPNRFTRAEKLRWCNELSALLSQEICKKYGVIECEARRGALPALPDGISLEDVENVTVGGAVYTKSDLRSFGGGAPCHDGGKVRVSYLKKYRPIRRIELCGEYEVSGGFIAMERPPFEVGDLIKIIGEFSEDGEPLEDSAVFVYVIEVLSGGIRISDGFSDEGNLTLSISRVITDDTLAPMPYDVMYVEYLLAKYASYSGDYESYRNFSAQFNDTLDSYANWYKAKNPLCRHSEFRRLWR